MNLYMFILINEGANCRQKIIAASKEAKHRYGISRDTPIDKAKRISDVILIKSRRDEYEKIANQLYLECLDCVVEEAHVSK